MSWNGYSQILPGYSMDPSKAKQPPKPRSLPPPGEAFDAARPKAKAKVLPKTKAAAKKPVAVKKPVATKKTPAKLKPSAAKSNNGGRNAGQVKAGNGVTKPVAGKKGKQAKTKAPSIWDFVKHESVGASGSFSASRKNVERQSVLVRPTANTEWLKKNQEGGNTAKKAVKVSVKVEAKVEVKAFRVMDLPKELRAMIWREAVVYPHCFVRPEEKRGQEQPDLAMTCRQVRQEVLPIYYAENVFAINVTAYEMNSSFIRKWATALEGTSDKPGWFSMIRKWSFNYTTDSVTISGDGERKTICNDAYVAVTFRRMQFEGIFWDAEVEIHREARCILPRYDQFGMCKVQTVPAWLNKVVIEATEAGQGGDIGKEMIIELAKAIIREGSRLLELTCEEASKSVEQSASSFFHPSCTGALTLGATAKRALRDY